mmetsp:Transcript_4967/g.12851  ORF Transcript_4967/g.12851 Transcript_4967/m.12851 type:complete len:224 (+) Transcript_4967:404-1075(+)
MPWMSAQVAKMPNAAACVTALSCETCSTASPAGRLMLDIMFSFFGGGLYLGTSANRTVVSTCPLRRRFMLCISIASYAASTLLVATEPSEIFAFFAATICSKLAFSATSRITSASSTDIASDGASLPSELLATRQRWRVPGDVHSPDAGIPRGTRNWAARKATGGPTGLVRASGVAQQERRAHAIAAFLLAPVSLVRWRRENPARRGKTIVAARIARLSPFLN